MSINELVQLLSQSPLQLQLGGVTGAAAAATRAVARIRLFGGSIAISHLSELGVLLGEQSVVLSLVQPHPDLTPAYQFSLSSIPTPELLQHLSEWATAAGLELVCQTTFPTLSKPGVLVMDMDSTAIQIECIDEIATLAGTGEQVAAVTARAMNGELDFAQSLRERVATLAGASSGILQQVLDVLPLMPGLETLVTRLQQQQWQVVIASGGFTFFTEALKQRLQLTATFANQLDIVDGRLTGRVLGHIVDAQYKARVVELIRQQYDIAPEQTVAIGDGANDLPMLAQAALGVAFHAKPKVQAQAKAAIRHGSLLQLLYLLD